MKLIVVLSVIFAVVAQEQEKNDTIMGSGQECEMPWHHARMFNPKMFLKKFMKLCVEVRFPKELFKQCKQCMKEEAKKSDLVDNMLKGNFPKKEELGKFIESMEVCKLKAGGINNIERDLTIDKLLNAMMYEKWTGSQQAKEELKQQMTTCFNQAQGNGYKKLIDYHKCINKYLLEECSRKEEEPGMMLIIASKYLTLNDESKCSPVKLPQDLKQVTDRCFQQAKNSMRKMPESETKSTSKSGSREFIHSMRLVKHFMKDFVMKAAECFLSENGMFNAEMKKFNLTGMTEYVKSFQGWDMIQRERDEVLNAIRDCGKSFEEDSDMMDSEEEEEEENYSSNAQNMEDKKMKQLMKIKMKFEKCFAPKFADICGINNELADFFYPMLNPDFMSGLVKAFMEVGGKEAENMMTMLKEKIKE